MTAATPIRAQVRGTASMQRTSLGAPVVLDSARIVAAADLAAGARAIAAQPDVPRNLTALLTDADNSITAVTLTIVGITPQGVTVTDVLSRTQLVAGWVGANIYAVVSSVTVSGLAGVVTATADLLRVGVGNVIGLPAPIDKASQVKHVYLGGARVAGAAIALGPNSSGVDASAATYNGIKEAVVFYNPMER